MRRTTPIVSLLQELETEGQLESTGRFSLATDKLREKLAVFQFERPSQWILKVIQGLVAAGASSIVIKHSYNKTTVIYQLGSSIWTHDELREAFCAERTDCKAGLKHLVLALWHLSFHQKVKWVSIIEGQASRLSWSSNELDSQSISIQTTSSLEIDYSSTPGSESMLGDLASNLGLWRPRLAAELSQELSNWAYACPIHLEIDGRRIDNLCGYPLLSQSTGSPLQGKITAHLTSVGWGNEDKSDCKIRIPPATRPLQPDAFVDPHWLDLAPKAETDWAALLLLHLKSVGPCPQPSMLNWVSHGVIVKQIPIPTASAVSCHLFASAENLAHDLSGLQLADWVCTASLPASAYLEVGLWLSQQTISFEPRAAQKRTWGNIGLAAAVTLAPAAAYFGIGGGLEYLETLMLSTAAVWSVPIAALNRAKNDDSKNLEQQFAAELQSLHSQWIQSTGNSGSTASAVASPRPKKTSKPKGRAKGQ